MKFELLVGLVPCLLLLISTAAVAEDPAEAPAPKAADDSLTGTVLNELLEYGEGVAKDLWDKYSPVALDKIVEFGVKLLDFIDKKRSGTRKINQIFEDLAVVNKRVMYYGQVSLQRGLETMELLAKFNNRKEVQQLHNLLDSVNRDYENNFVRCFLNSDRCLVQSKESFATAYTTFYHNEARTRLEEIRRLVVPPAASGVVEQNNERLFDLMIEHNQLQHETGYDCGATRAFNQQIYHLYNLIISTLTRGYVMVRMSYIYQYREELKNDRTPIGWQGEWESILNVFKSDALAISVAAQDALKRAAKDIRPCDPPAWKEGENYGRLVHFLEGYLTNEIVLNAGHSCGYECAFGNVTHHPFGAYPEKLSCTGGIRSCHKTKFNAAWVSDEQHDRRYNEVGRVETGPEGQHFISMRTGTGMYEGTMYDKSLLRPVGRNGFLHTNKCSMCLCTCDDYKHPESVRRIYNGWVHTINENSVVTGVRLRIVQKVLVIQIQEGHLLNGTVDRETVHWMAVDEEALARGDNVETLDYDHRSIMLDDLQLPPSSVVTAVAFKKGKHHHGLAITGRPLDEFGNLSPEAAEVIVKHPEGIRETVAPANLLLPTLATSRNVVASQSGKNYVEFTTTGWTGDAAQNVVPFLDYQDVVFDPVSPLGGVGLFYKSAINHGGFLGLKVMSPDYSNVIDPAKISESFDELLNKVRKSTRISSITHYDA